MMTNTQSLPSPPQQHNVMTRDQHKYCVAIIRNLKKHRDAAPFLNPVDYIKLNVPDYPNIISTPMDLKLVDKKLNNMEYHAVEDFVSDVRLIFNNCFKFNGPEAMISVLCQNVESAFEKSLRQMPPSSMLATIEKEPSPPISQHSSPVSYQQEYFYKPISEDINSRPKREIHCPSKDYPETFTKKQTNNSMVYCMTILKELKKNKYRHISYPFLQPVDPVELDIPDYFNIVKTPMDLSTVESKLNNNQYNTPDEFKKDIILMFENCYLYNPPHLPIYKMGQELEKVFLNKWAKKPSNQPTTTHKKKKVMSRKKTVDADDKDNKIAELERHIATISQQIKSIKSSKKQPVKRKRVTKKQESSDEDSEAEFTFEEKKQLSESINNLTGDKLNTVVAIIQSSMPNLGNSGQEEIVLDIDSLDKTTLRKLSDIVHSKPHHKKQKTIHKLEQTLKKFETDSSSSDSDSGDEDDNASSSSDSD